jgi:hypothetical protein
MESITAHIYIIQYLLNILNAIEMADTRAKSSVLSLKNAGWQE